jgi:hypothetical protein
MILLKSVASLKRFLQNNLEKQNIFRILTYNIKNTDMRQYIRILEVPFYLLVIALACLERGNPGVAVMLVLVSVGRLIVNSVTDEFNYKR